MKKSPRPSVCSSLTSLASISTFEVFSLLVQTKLLSLRGVPLKLTDQSWQEDITGSRGGEVSETCWKDHDVQVLV